MRAVGWAFAKRALRDDASAVPLKRAVIDALLPYGLLSAEFKDRSCAAYAASIVAIMAQLDAPYVVPQLVGKALLVLQSSTAAGKTSGTLTLLAAASRESCLGRSWSLAVVIAQQGLTIWTMLHIIFNYYHHHNNNLFILLSQAA